MACSATVMTIQLDDEARREPVGGSVSSGVGAKGGKRGVELEKRGDEEGNWGRRCSGLNWSERNGMGEQMVVQHSLKKLELVTGFSLVCLVRHLQAGLRAVATRYKFH